MALGNLYKQMQESGPLSGAKYYSGLKDMKKSMDENKAARAKKKEAKEVESGLKKRTVEDREFTKGGLLEK